MNDIKSCDDWIDELAPKVEKMPKIQTALANFELLPRLGSLLEEKQEKCSECKVYWKKLQDSTSHFEEFFDGGNNYMVDFENLAEEIMKHLKTNHSIRPKGLILSYKTIVGMLVGLCIGSLVGLIPVVSMKAGVLLGWMLGVLVGWFWGKHVEKKMKRANNIF